MKFIKSSVLATVVLVSGCSMNATQPQIAATPGLTPDAQAPVISSNPYELNRKAPSRKALGLYEQANAAIDAQQWQKAELILQELTVDYPQLSGPWLSLGLVYLNSERPQDAVAALDTAVAVNPDNLDAYNLKAYVLRTEGEFSAAESTYQQALAVWPEHAGSHLNLAILYDLYMGRFSDAARHYDSYQQLQPEPDRRVAGWQADLKRRKQVLATAGSGS